MKPSAAVLGVVLALALLVAPVPSPGQPPAKVYRIGWLSIASRTPQVSHFIEAFLQGLRELGYVEGQNIAIEGGSRRGGMSDSPSSRPNSSI